jgi:integrase
MAVYRPAKSKFWWGRFTINGRRLARSLRTTDKREAERRFQAWKSQEVDAAYYGIKRMSWPEAVNAFLRDNPTSAKPNTIKRYVTSLRTVNDHLAALFCDQIKRGTLIKLIGDRRRQKATNATINRDLTAISRVLAHAVSAEAIERNPCDLVSRRDTNREKRPARVPPAEHEVMRLADAAGPMLGGLVRLLNATGMRLEEAASLEWRQIDSNRRVIRLYETKTGRPRMIDTDERTVAILSAIPRRLGCQWVFWHGDPPSRYHWASNQLAATKRRLGFKWVIHDIRHKHAIEWLEAGGDLYALSRRLGHGSVKTTEETYLRHLSEQQRRSVSSGV